jgi:hypothetical protein
VAGKGQKRAGKCAKPQATGKLRARKRAGSTASDLLKIDSQILFPLELAADKLS